MMNGGKNKMAIPVKIYDHKPIINYYFSVNPGASLNEICKKLKVPKSVVSRVLSIEMMKRMKRK